MTKTIDFEYKSATCQVVDWGDGTATLSDLYSTVRRQGHAKGLLNEVICWVDSHKLILALAAEVYGEEPRMPHSQLLNFYKKFGFVSVVIAPNYVYMERKPQIVSSGRAP